MLIKTALYMVTSLSKGIRTFSKVVLLMVGLESLLCREGFSYTCPLRLKQACPKEGFFSSYVCVHPLVVVCPPQSRLLQGSLASPVPQSHFHLALMRAEQQPHVYGLKSIVSPLTIFVLCLFKGKQCCILCLRRSIKGFHS